MKHLLPFLFVLLTSVQAATIDEALALPKRWDKKVLNEMLTPHWLPDGESFWYWRQTAADKKECVLIQAGTAERKVAARHEELHLTAPPPRRSSKDGMWSRSASPKDRPPIRVTFVNEWHETLEVYWLDFTARKKSYGLLKVGDKISRSSFKGHRWWFEDTKTKKAIAVMETVEDGEQLIIDGYPPRSVMQPKPKTQSSDDNWSVIVKPGQVSLKDLQTSQSMDLKVEANSKASFMGTVTWSPDSSAFVVPRVIDVQKQKLALVESMPKGSLRPLSKLEDYIRPGDPLPKPVPVLFRRSDRKGIPVADDLFPNPFTESSDLRVRWSEDSREFYFDYNQRGHQLYRIIAVNAETGKARLVVEETSQTFIDYVRKTWRHWLDKTGEVLWMSERDGRTHLWLYDIATGTVKQQVTKGPWLVREVLRVNEAQRQVWFMASGLHTKEDPYQRHLCRVNLDGSGFVQLTTGDGDHDVQFSPNNRWFIDSWSRADAPAVMELRLSSDGSKVCDLEETDIAALLANAWQMPERFVAKGRDGKTDIHGVIIKPSHFDATKKYPVVEEIYAGPHGSFAPKKFGLMARHHQIAELGFIVVQLDGMGTNNRGKTFHDVCWKNLKDAGFPDRKLWIKAAAKTRPWMDLTRVGIYGGSAGGQNAMRALLDHHDFYKVAVADCGCHDNRMDKIWWNEQWMGWPLDDSYVKSSNREDARKLQGNLLLIVGELDTNVDPATTLQVVGALQKAGKQFDFMPVIGAGHGAAETPFGSRLRMQFLVKHLQP